VANTDAKQKIAKGTKPPEIGGEWQKNGGRKIRKKVRGVYPRMTRIGANGKAEDRRLKIESWKDEQGIVLTANLG